MLPSQETRHSHRTVTKITTPSIDAPKSYETGVGLSGHLAPIRSSTIKITVSREHPEL